MDAESSWKHTILIDNEELILRNLSVTEDLLGRLRDVDLISDTMAGDVKENGLIDNEKRARLLLSFVCRKVPHGGNFELFCDALEFCGHQILAFFLRGEVLGQEMASTKRKTSNGITDDRMRLEIGAAYSRALAVMRSKTEVVKMDEMDHILTIRRLKQQLTNKTDQIKSLEETLYSEKGNAEDLRCQVKKLNDEMNGGREKVQGFMAQQGKAADARENHIRRLDERITLFDRQVVELNSRILSILGETREEMYCAPDNAHINVLDKNLDKLVKGMGSAQKRYCSEKFAHDATKSSVLTLLGLTPFVQDPVKALEEYTSRTNTEKAGVERKVNNLISLLTEDMSDIEKSDLSNEPWESIFTLVEGFKKRLLNQSTEIGNLNTQIRTLQSELSKLKQSSSVQRIAGSPRRATIDRGPVTNGPPAATAHRALSKAQRGSVPEIQISLNQQFRQNNRK